MNQTIELDKLHGDQNQVLYMKPPKSAKNGKK